MVTPLEQQENARYRTARLSHFHYERMTDSRSLCSTGELEYPFVVSTGLLNTKNGFVYSRRGRTDVNQLASSGTVLVGIGCVGGAIATVQGSRFAVLTSVFVLLVGVGVVLWGRYR